MTKLLRSWFSNARPLPLDKFGCVDLSQNSNDTVEDKNLVDPATAERYMGLMFKRLMLPNQDRIILLYYWDATDADLSLHDVNHNIFRLNPQGEMVWQVRRDDSIRPPDWWDILHRQARERGEDGAREPFVYLTLKYPDGTDNVNPRNGSPPDEAVWTPGCTIELSGSFYQQYTLDPDTGVALNVTVGRPRPW